MVDDFLNSKDTPPVENDVVALAINDVETLEENADNTVQHLNYKLVDMTTEGLSDAGKTILNMSRANYSNAIYMDRLNKRLGEARYINGEEEDGMWVSAMTALARMMLTAVRTPCMNLAMTRNRNAITANAA